MVEEMEVEGTRGIWQQSICLFICLLEKTNKSVFICGWESMCRRKEGNIVEAGLSEAHLAFQRFPQG